MENSTALYCAPQSFDPDDLPLTTPERRFVLTYVRTSNGRQAAIEAGYPAPVAQKTANRMLYTERIRRAIRDEQDRITRNLGITAQQVIANLMNLASSNMGDYLEAQYDEQGNYLGRTINLEHLSRQQMACVQEYSLGADGMPRVKLYDKKAALDTLAKMFEMTPEVIRVILPDLIPMKQPKVIDAEPQDTQSAAAAYAALLDDAA